jgi:hypothetical protein
LNQYELSAPNACHIKLLQDQHIWMQSGNSISLDGANLVYVRSNDEMVSVIPRGVVLSPGTGIHNLANKAAVLLPNVKKAHILKRFAKGRHVRYKENVKSL